MLFFLLFKRGSAQKYERPRWLFYKFASHYYSPFIRCCSFFGKAGARNSRSASALGLMLYQKNLCSFCLLSCWVFKIAMYCFSFSQRASAQKYARSRWLFYKFSPAVIERCIKFASPRTAANMLCGAAAFEKKVIYFNHLSFPIVQFKRSIFMDFF